MVNRQGRVHKMKPEFSTTLAVMKRVIPERRNLGQRRWGLSTEFPLKDCNGSLVIAERRRLADRRLENTTLEDRLLMFSGLVLVDRDNNLS
jgi:hypothetical protein